MPKLARILDTLTGQHPKELSSSLVRIDSLRPGLAGRKDVRPHNAGVQDRDDHALLPQLNRQVLADLVERRLGGPVGVIATRGVVGDGAHPARDEAQSGLGGGGLEDVGEQGLGEQEWAEGVHGEDAR